MTLKDYIERERLTDEELNQLKEELHKDRIRKGIGKTLWCLTGIRSCDTNSGIKKLCAHILPISACCPLRRLGSNASVAGNTPKPKSWFLNTLHH